MIFSLAILVLLIIIVVLIASRIANLKSANHLKENFTIRIVFQYLILFGLMVVVSVGLSGLLGRLLDSSQIIVEDKTALALNITYVLVGVPFLWGIARWTFKNFKNNPNEKKSIVWQIYLTLIGITSLGIFLDAIHNFLSWIFQQDNFRGYDLARVLIWGSVWIFHWKWLENKNLKVHVLVGSVIGLVILVVGLSGTIGHSLDEIFSIQYDAVIVSSSDSVINSLINLFIGIVTFYIYWVKTAKNLTKETLWFSYLFLIGIASGFITLIVSLCIVIYNNLIYFFGSTEKINYLENLSSISMPVGSLVAGLSVWIYHRGIIHGLDSNTNKSELEVSRIYQYVVSSISLIATLYGLVMVFVAFIELLVPATIAKSQSSINNLILAITLLIVGTPIWAFFWSRIELASKKNYEDRSSNTRKIFLLLLFGISSLVAVISLIYGVFNFVISVLNGEVGLETLRQTRYALGILIMTLLVASYHWSVYQDKTKFEKKQAVKQS